MNTTSKTILGCPHCHARPTIDQLVDGVRVNCGRHPGTPVFLSEASLEIAIESWNDSAEWALIGGNEVIPSMLDNRPIFQI